MQLEIKFKSFIWHTITLRVMVIQSIGKTNISHVYHVIAMPKF